MTARGLLLGFLLVLIISRSNPVASVAVCVPRLTGYFNWTLVDSAPTKLVPISAEALVLVATAINDDSKPVGVLLTLSATNGSMLRTCTIPGSATSHGFTVVAATRNSAGNFIMLGRGCSVDEDSDLCPYDQILVREVNPSTCHIGLSTIHFGGSDEDSPLGVAVDSSNQYIITLASTQRTDYFDAWPIPPVRVPYGTTVGVVSLLNATSGELIWNAFQVDQNSSVSVVMTPHFAKVTSTDILVVGEKQIGNGPSVVHIAVYSRSSGAIIWSQDLAAAMQSVVVAVLVAPTNPMIVYVVVKLISSTLVKRTKLIQCNLAVRTGSSCFPIINAMPDDTTTGSSEPVDAAISAMGYISMVMTLTGYQPFQTNPIMICGQLFPFFDHGGSDIVVVVFDPINLKPMSYDSYGGPGDDTAAAIALLPSPNDPSASPTAWVLGTTTDQTCSNNNDGDDDDDDDDQVTIMSSACNSHRPDEYCLPSPRDSVCAPKQCMWTVPCSKLGGGVICPGNGKSYSLCVNGTEPICTPTYAEYIANPSSNATIDCVCPNAIPDAVPDPHPQPHDVDTITFVALVIVTALGFMAFIGSLYLHLKDQCCRSQAIAPPRSQPALHHNHNRNRQSGGGNCTQQSIITINASGSAKVHIKSAGPNATSYESHYQPLPVSVSPLSAAPPPPQI